MSPTLVLTVLGAVTAMAAAAKAVTYLLSLIGRIQARGQALNDLPEFQRKTQATLDALVGQVGAAAVQLESIADIKDIVRQFSSTVESLSDSAVDLAVTTFKAHTIHCLTASYIIATSEDGKGEFIWANPIWYKLHGIGYTEAMNGQFWHSVAVEDRPRVKDASDSSALHRLEYRVSYSNVNQKTGLVTRVQAQAWPLIPYGVQEGDSVLFLGAIKDLDQDLDLLPHDVLSDEEMQHFDSPMG